MVVVNCRTHVRRRFVKRRENDGSPIAGQALRQIAELYAIEASVRGRAPETRLAARTKLAAPIVAAFRPWLEAQLSRIPRASKLAEDIRYTLGIWPGLTRFLEDGRLELDTNPVENQTRPIALTRKTALFAGHEVGAETWAMLASLVATCKMSDVNPVDYLADTLRALLDGHPKRRIDELMPWQFRRAPSLAAQAPGKALTKEPSCQPVCCSQHEANCSHFFEVENRQQSIVIVGRFPIGTSSLDERGSKRSAGGLCSDLRRRRRGLWCSRYRARYFAHTEFAALREGSLKCLTRSRADLGSVACRRTSLKCGQGASVNLNLASARCDQMSLRDAGAARATYPIRTEALCPAAMGNKTVWSL